MKEKLNMNNLQKQYAALCCYFGQWPAHFGQWLMTCSFNPKIDFILVSDISVEAYRIPDNVQVVKRSFEQVKELIQQKYPTIQISLERPYKLCDFKTAYGYIFADLFNGYDYWGFYDIDTLWGDIIHFIPENSHSYQVKIFPCGHLSFIRNIAPWNKIYELVNQVEGVSCSNNMEGKTISTWQDCFSSPESNYYDEEGGLEPLLNHLNVPQYSGVDFDNILPPWRFDHFYSINFPEKSHFLVYSYEEGHLFRLFLKGCKIIKEEISYVHLSKRKVRVSVTPQKESFTFYPNVITNLTSWSIVTLIMLGRKRYVSNTIRRILHKLCP